MIELKDKIKKIQPLISARRSKLDHETARLHEIKGAKLNALQSLEYYQKQYISGVDSLNLERQSSDRQKLAVLERSVDTAKSRWYQSLRQVREIEELERDQIKLVLKAQRDLRSIEMLQENYQGEYAEAFRKAEQKALDEMSNKQFNQKSKRY